MFSETEAVLYAHLSAAEDDRDHYKAALERVIRTWEQGPHPRGPRMLVAIAKDALRLAPSNQRQGD